MSNISCRLFKEQIDLLRSLPNQEEAKTILYEAVVRSLNQFENQNENQFENQFENQNENAYISVSLSESVSLSSVNIYILELLFKNITWKEFSNNYGGKRDNSGRKKNNNNLNQENNLNKPSIEEINKFIVSSKININAKRFFDYYEKQGWCEKDGTPIAWKEKLLHWYIRDLNEDNPYKVEWH